MCAEQAASGHSVPPHTRRAVLVVLVVVMVVMVLLPLCLLSQPETLMCTLLLPWFYPPLVLAEGQFSLPCWHPGRSGAGGRRWMGVPEWCQCIGCQTERGGLEQDPLLRIPSAKNLWGSSW